MAGYYGTLPALSRAPVTLRRKVLAAVAFAALMTIAATMVLISRVTSRQELLTHYSTQQSNQDIDDIFDNLPGSKPHTVKHQSRHESDQHHADVKVKSRHVGNQPKVAPSKHSKIATAVNNYFIKTDASKLSPEHRQNKDELRSYKLMHPKFAEKMQKVHAAWLKTHDGLPKSKAEKEEYADLVKKMVGNVGTIVENG